VRGAIIGRAEGALFRRCHEMLEFDEDKESLLPQPDRARQSYLRRCQKPILVLLSLLAISQCLSYDWSFDLRGRSCRMDYEELLLSLPSNTSIAAFSRNLSKYPHIASTEGDFETVTYVKAIYERALGLPLSKKTDKVYDAGSVESREAFEKIEGVSVHVDMCVLARTPCLAQRPVRYYSLLNFPLSKPSAVLFDRDGKILVEAKLEEDVVEQDPSSKIGAAQVPVFHGFSKAGKARGPLVYANAGTKEDFEELSRRGIPVKGSVVIVRYGGAFRGLKVSNAEDAGAAGVIVYSDPAEDGNTTTANGDEAYPDGPARQPSSVQRGSVQKLTLYPGDPLTPGTPSYKNATRLARDASGLNIPGIPSVPMSYQDARPLLASLAGRGDSIPSWQGGLPDLEYFTGPSEGVRKLCPPRISI
jgi:N-acetylated-alpha-linked acidic dipeptidase